MSLLNTVIYLAITAVSVPSVIVLSLVNMLFQRRTEKDICGEVAVITGSARGLGKAIAIELAKRGCNVAIVDIDLPNAEITANEIQERYNVKTKAYKVDVTSYEAVVALNAAVTQDLGPTTILVNNAGILLFSNFKNPDWREIQKMIEVNLIAHFWTNSIFLPKMKELKRGNIVAISSLSSLMPLVYHSQYTSTKFAVRGMMRSLRLELMDGDYDAIDTTTVMPGFLDTNQQVNELIGLVKVERIYPLIKGEYAAERIVKGMLRGEREIVLPFFMNIIYRIFHCLPVLIQDYILFFAMRMGAPTFKNLFSN